MSRFSELLEKRKNLEANIFEENELIELSKNLSQGELDAIDPELLTLSNGIRLDKVMSILDRLDSVIGCGIKNKTS